MKVLNFGSLNIDYTYRVEHIATPGETISSKSLEVFPGGKGLNQSVALAKAGAEVYHAGMIGEDGMFLKDFCQENRVNTEFIEVVNVRTGNAIIQVSDEGQNSIILFPGANRNITKEFIELVLTHFEAGDFLLLQNEINQVDYLIEAAKKRGMIIVLNPSPYDERLEKCDLSKVDIFLMNEVEGAQITGKCEEEQILEKIKVLYPQAATVLTLGEKGSICSWQGTVYRQPAISTEVIDTTAAGDTFTGYFLCGLMEDMEKGQALNMAAHASAIAVSRKGASVSIPLRLEVEQKLTVKN